MIDSRVSKDGTTIRRRRECVECEYRFTTYEVVERADLRVVKRDGRRELLDRQKLLSGVVKACEKRPVPYDDQERAVEEIIQELESDIGREIPSNLIGAKVMEKLHAMDGVAYVRYASVYRQFQDIGEFIEEVQAMERRPRPNANQSELFR